MITNTERTQVRQLLQSPQWPVAERLADMLIDQIKEEPSLADTEWQTLQNVLTREGEMRGIRRFIQECYTQAQQT